MRFNSQDSNLRLSVRRIAAPCGTMSARGSKRNVRCGRKADIVQTTEFGCCAAMATSATPTSSPAWIFDICERLLPPNPAASRSNTKPHAGQANCNDGCNNYAARDIWEPIAVHVVTKSGIMRGCKPSGRRPSVVADTYPSAPPTATLLGRHPTMRRTDCGTVSEHAQSTELYCRCNDYRSL
jgi:hypothetical protein